jgi:hypothetical protein
MINTLSIYNLRIAVEKIRWKDSLEIMTLDDGEGHVVLVLATLSSGEICPDERF